jgi:hypothetical protein
MSVKMITQYYLVDWVGMCCIILTIYKIGEKKRCGFLFGVMGSIAWLIFSVLAQSLASISLNIIMIGLYIRGYVKWGHEEKKGLF